MGLLDRIQRNERLKKRQQLRKIIEEVLAGKFNSTKKSIDNNPRSEYLSPAERSTYNYGYMTGIEMFGLSNEG